MKIIFLGTPNFGVPSLEMLVRRGYDIAAVFTQPDRPRDRGHRLSASPVKKAALALGLPVFSPARIRDIESVTQLRELAPDGMVTAAYGQILSQKILDIPPMGCVNVHASLLPAYRGPAPIQWAVINGEKRTGVTTMKTVRGVDCGPILLQRAVDIGPRETAGELFDRLSLLGARVLDETLAALSAGTLTPTPQDESLATHFPMLTREDGRIDWSQPARRIADRIRGVNPWPGAYTRLGGDILKLWAAHALAQDAGAAPGTVLAADPREGLVVAAGEGRVRLDSIQAAGGKPLAAEDWLRGHGLVPGTVLGL